MSPLISFYDPNSRLSGVELIVKFNQKPVPLYLYYILRRLLKKRCRTLPARGLGGVSPPDIKIPQDWGIRGLIESI
jgi:hypothetical protein